MFLHHYSHQSIVATLVSNSPYGLYGRKAALNLNVGHKRRRSDLRSNLKQDVR